MAQQQQQKNNGAEIDLAKQEKEKIKNFLLELLLYCCPSPIISQR